MILRIISAPILGGIIGCITNDIAIKMLFHPREPIYIGKHKLPFTPGLIPSQKDRIAKSIGRMVSTQLLDPESIKATLLSPESLDNITNKFRSVLEGFKNDERTVKELLTLWIGEDKFDEVLGTAMENLTLLLVRKLEETGFSDSAAKYVVGKIAAKAKSTVLKPLISDDFISRLEKQLSDMISDMIKKNAAPLLKPEIEKLADNFAEKKLCDIYAKYEDKIPQAAEYLTKLYKNILENNIEKILNAVNIEEIVVNKITSFDAQMLENLILSLMKRELKAIVFLGGLLGFLMGFINIAFLYI